MRNASRSRLARDQTNGQRPLVKIPNFFARPADDERRRLNLMLLERLTQLPDQFHLKLIHKHLARWQAEVANLGRSSIGILPNANDQAEAQRLFPVIRGHMRRALIDTRRLCKWRN